MRIQGMQRSLPQFQLLPEALVFTPHVGVGTDIDETRIVVENHGSTVFQVVRDSRDAHETGYAQRTRQNGGMRSASAFFADDSEQPLGLEINEVRRQQFHGGDDSAFQGGFAHPYRVVDFEEGVDEPERHILQVRAFGGEDGAFGAVEGFQQVARRQFDGERRRHFFADMAFNGADEFGVAQHEQVGFENERVHFGE